MWLSLTTGRTGVVDCEVVNTGGLSFKECWLGHININFFIVFKIFISLFYSIFYLFGGITIWFEVFSTLHHSIELFHHPTLMHKFLYLLTICLLHYYPRHVSSINMPIFRRKNCIHTASGIFALYKHLHSTLVESSQQVYCADVYRARRYQMLCEYNFSSWRWAC